MLPPNSYVSANRQATTIPDLGFAPPKPGLFLRIVTFRYRLKRTLPSRIRLHKPHAQWRLRWNCCRARRMMRRPPRSSMLMGVEAALGLIGRSQGDVAPTKHEVAHSVGQALHVPGDHRGAIRAHRSFAELVGEFAI